MSSYRAQRDVEHRSTRVCRPEMHGAPRVTLGARQKERERDDLQTRAEADTRSISELVRLTRAAMTATTDIDNEEFSS